MDRYFKLSFMISLYAFAPQLCAMDPESMHRLLGQEHIRDVICRHLSEKDLNRLSQANRQVRGYVGPVLDERMTERAINYSKALSAVMLNFASRRHGAHNKDLRNYVLKSIRHFALPNAGKWIGLNLANNSLGNDLKFFEQLMQDVIALVRELKIDIATLYLHCNYLAALPTKIFDDLTQLQKLDLGSNSFAALPEQTFAGLTQVQELNLGNNFFTALPGPIFVKLTQLKELYLYNNNLTGLPEHMLAGLTQLKTLDLRHNQLPPNQVLDVPAGCKVLR